MATSLRDVPTKLILYTPIALADISTTKLRGSVILGADQWRMFMRETAPNAMAREAEGQRYHGDATSQYHNDRWNWDVGPHTHMALEHTFTALGFIYYTNLTQ